MIKSKQCALWTEKLTTLRPEDLSRDEYHGLRSHLNSCSNCARLYQQYTLLTAHLRSLTPVQPFPQTSPELPWHQISNKEFPLKRRYSISIQRLFSSPSSFAIGGAFLVIIFFLVSLIFLQSHLFLPFSQQPSSAAGEPRHQSMVGTSNDCSFPTTDSCTARYSGTLYPSTKANSIPILLSIQQHQQIITGTGTVARPVIADGSLTGTINLDGSIQFTLQDTKRHFTITFQGTIHLDNGGADGTYSTSQHQKGTWSIHILQ